VRKSAAQGPLAKFSPVLQFFVHEVLRCTGKKICHHHRLLLRRGTDADMPELRTMTAFEDEHLKSIGTQRHP
jgi:hypothetical protein